MSCPLKGRAHPEGRGIMKLLYKKENQKGEQSVAEKGCLMSFYLKGDRITK